MSTALKTACDLLQEQLIEKAAGSARVDDMAGFLALIPHNLAYNAEHRLTDKDIQKVTAIRAGIEQRVAPGVVPVPMAGDAVIIEGKGGVCYQNGRMDESRWETDRMALCTKPYIPHIHPELTVSTSGGYWVAADNAQLIHEGTREVMFWTWGHNGACGGGGVHFTATVNLWRYTDTDKVY